MFIANDSKGNRVNIQDAIKGNLYFCPICKAPLVVKDGQINAKHFAHSIGTLCYDSWSHDMSEWHSNWQMKFPIENREIVLKNKNAIHRADIIIDNTVIEFQHSPIKKEEIDERNKFFTDLNYNVVWVFDADEKIRNWIEESNEKIDPLKCGNEDLCWKRKNNQFDFKFKNKKQPYIVYNKGKVSVYIQYRINQTQILLELRSVSSKYFEFYTTDKHITEEDFVNLFLNKSKTYSINDKIAINKQPIRTRKIFLKIPKKRRNWWL